MSTIISTNITIADMDEDISTTAIDMKRLPSPRLKRGVQFFHTRRSGMTIANMVGDTHTTAVKMETSPSPDIEEFEDGNLEPSRLVKHFEPDHAQEKGNIMETSPSDSLKRGIGEVETSTPCNGNPSPPESVKRVKIEHAQENGKITDDKAMTVKPRGILRPRNSNDVVLQVPPTSFDNLNIQEISVGTQITERKSVHWDPDGDNDQTLWIEEKSKREEQSRAKERAEPCFSVDFFNKKEEWRDFVDNSDLAKALKSAPEEMINEIANHLVTEQSSTLKVITKRVQDESEDEVIRFTDSAALLCFRKELLLALEPYFGMQYILCGSCETLHRHCHCCSKIDYTTEPPPAKACPSRVSVREGRQWGALSLKPIDFAHIQKGMKAERSYLKHSSFNPFTLSRKTMYMCGDKTYRVIQINEVFSTEEKGLRLLHRKQDWFFGAANFEEYEGDKYKNDWYHLLDETGPTKGWREDEEPVNDWALGGIRKTFETDEEWELDVKDCLSRKHLKLLTDLSNSNEL